MNLKFNLLILLLSTVSYIQASKLVKVEIVDREYIMVHFKDGDVLRKDDGKGKCDFMVTAIVLMVVTPNIMETDWM